MTLNLPKDYQFCKDKKNCYFVIGVMSGTSLDGLDMAYCIFNFDDYVDYEIIFAETYQYSPDIQKHLNDAVYYTKKELIQLDYEYTKIIGNYINHFIRKHYIENIDIISSHGHTVFHNPQRGLTYQLGSLPMLSKIIGVMTVSDFRTQDILLGGEGAPLVPVGDELLFGDYKYCINIGGITNISFSNGTDRIAFDICPANMLLNHYAQKLGHSYDEDGKLAKKGKLHKTLLRTLNNIPYYQKHPPKSIGKEWVEDIVVPIIHSYSLETLDILNTVVEHIAVQTAGHIQKESKVLVTGGGALNTYLIERIEAQAKTKLTIPNRNLIDYKEALIFGLLGVLRVLQKNNCLKSVTGAKKDHCSGNISMNGAFCF